MKADEVSSIISPIQFLDQEQVHHLPVPLARIRCCGMIEVEVLKEVVSSDPPLGRYEILSPRTLRGRGAVPALMLLKLLVSQPHRFATKDWLSTQMHQEMEVGALVRLDTMASQLRTLLCGLEREETSAIRLLLVEYLRNGRSSGPGYQLAPYPLLWLDTDALAYCMEHATLMERMGEPALALPFWQRAYQLASRGTYLPDDPYSDWAQGLREAVEGAQRQSVHALARLYLAQHGEVGTEEAMRLLRSYWLAHKADEDALRPLMELLGREERYQEVEAYYQQLLHALREERERVPDPRTQDLHEFLRTKQIRREQKTSHRAEVIKAEKTPAPFSPNPQPDETFSPFSLAVTQGIIEAVNRSEEAIQQSGSQDMEPSRRGLLQALGVLGAELFISPAVFRVTDHVFLTSSNSPVSDNILDQCEKLTNLCWKLLKGNELAATEAILSLYLPHVVALAQQPSNQQRIIAYYAAHAFNIACLLAGHKNDLNIRLLRSQYSEQYSQLAQDRNLEVAALIQQCVTFDYCKEYNKSIQIYQKALRYSNEVSPLLRARIYAGLGGSYARYGQQEKKAQQYLSLAQEVMPTKPEEDTTFLYADCGHFTVPLWQGRMCLELDQLDEAWNVFSLAQHQQEMPARIHTEFLNHLLDTSILQGDRDKSLFSLEKAINAARALKSERRLREIYEAYERMRLLWRYEQQVKDALDLFQ